MSEIIKSVSIGIGVKDASEALNWYKQLLGDVEIMEPVPGLFEIKLGDALWLQLDDTGYLEIGGGSTIIRFETDDIETAYKKVIEVGFDVEPVSIVEGVVKYFDFKDLYGNRLSYVQIL